MTDDRETPELRRLGLEPNDLDGHTLEELSDYLDSGRSPADPSIDGSPGCLLALDALDRLRGLGGQLIDADAANGQEVEASWVDSILSGIAMDARAGRRIPFRSEDPTEDLGITEGAVRGLIRAAETGVPGLIVGRCRLDGDVSESGAPIHITLEASIRYGESIPRLTDLLRAEVAHRLSMHTELNVVGIDIAVRGLQEPGSPREEER